MIINAIGSEKLSYRCLVPTFCSFRYRWS